MLRNGLKAGKRNSPGISAHCQQGAILSKLADDINKVEEVCLGVQQLGKLLTWLVFSMAKSTIAQLIIEFIDLEEEIAKRIIKWFSNAINSKPMHHIMYGLHNVLSYDILHY